MPAFSARNLLLVLPSIIDEILVFRENLHAAAGANRAWGDVFQLEELTSNLTFDMITRAVL